MVAQHFEREDRYIVIKRKHLSEEQAGAIYQTLEMYDVAQVPKAVVVEGDWPEYEPVWAMIEARVSDGGTTFIEASSACPICGKDSPHYHAPLVADAHRRTIEQRNRERSRGR